jgi:hypothetical protein
MKRGAKGDPVVVVFDKSGRPKRIFGYDKYQRMQKLPAKVQPWKHRKASIAPDPLGAVRGKVIGRLSRDEIYD